MRGELAVGLGRGFGSAQKEPQFVPFEACILGCFLVMTVTLGSV